MMPFNTPASATLHLLRSTLLTLARPQTNCSNSAQSKATDAAEAATTVPGEAAAATHGAAP